MKTIPLKTLLESIIKLPWGRYSITSNIGKGRFQKWDNEDYALHCCNHFPELVEAVKDLRDKNGCWPWCAFRLTDKGVCNCHDHPLNKILASAETVQIED